MTSIDTDSPPPSSYNVSDVMKNWGESSITDKTVSVNNDDDVKTDSCDNKENNSVLVDNLSNYNNNCDRDYLKHELLSDSSGLVSGLSSGSGSEGIPPPPLSDRERRFNWERGQADYLGVDAFDNIQRKLLESLQGPPDESPASNSSPFIPKETPKPQPVSERKVEVTSSVKPVSSIPPQTAAAKTDTVTVQSKPATTTGVTSVKTIAIAPAKVTAAPATSKVTAPVSPTKIAPAPVSPTTKIAPAPVSPTTKIAPATQQATMGAPATKSVASRFGATAPAAKTQAAQPAPTAKVPAAQQAPAAKVPAAQPVPVEKAPAAVAKAPTAQPATAVKAPAAQPATAAKAPAAQPAPAAKAPATQPAPAEKPTSRFGVPSFLRKK
ncbi:hypothetical protein KUTeg_012194 [Tegillarca granosa]|uniref:Uncharacterized protein n=1 Tax=Tegillarca granosa TaxID=220873 RepID=A0ABQ9EYT4_TEGGR|nr:hypothetical protein KUTeg_012194 [Tegillarca granosa]